MDPMMAVALLSWERTWAGGCVSVALDGGTAHERTYR